MSMFERYNRVYANYFPDPKPTRTTVGSQLPGILVEIDAIAYVGKHSSSSATRIASGVSYRWAAITARTIPVLR
jgi:hypothetical protein